MGLWETGARVVHGISCFAAEGPAWDPRGARVGPAWEDPRGTRVGPAWDPRGTRGV